MPTPVPGSPAPDLNVDLVGNGSFKLADATPDAFTMVVFYRGLHCPVCKSYLKELDGLLDEYRELGVEVVAVSTDPEERATKSVNEWELDELKVGYGLSEDDARRWGLYISSAIKDGEPDTFAEPGLFLVRPDNTLYYAAINSMPWGRPDLSELPKAIRFIQEKDYPARGVEG